jgi:hypothetical protein
MAKKAGPKSWEIRGHDTVASLCNSLARKIGRGDLEIDQEVHCKHLGEGILPDGRYFVIHARMVFMVEIAREIKPEPSEHIEVKPVRE